MHPRRFQRHKPRFGFAVLTWLPTVLVVSPLVGLSLSTDARRMMFFRPIHGGANPVAAARQVFRGIEPYLLDHGNFRPIGRLWEWLVIALAYDTSEAAALPPHVVLGGIRLLMAACVAVSAAALVRALMRSAGVEKSLVSLYPLVLAGLLITNRGNGGFGALPQMFAGSVALMLVITLTVCRDKDFESRSLRFHEYLLMAFGGVVAAAFYDLMYLTPVLAAVFLMSRAIAAGISFRALLSTAAVRRWLVFATAFALVFIPTRVIIAFNCAAGGCYEGSSASLTKAAFSTILGRLWSGLPPFGWAEASERSQRAGAELGFLDLWDNSYIAIVLMAIVALAVAIAQRAASPIWTAAEGATAGGGQANPRHGQLALALCLVGITAAAGAAVIAGLSERMQNSQIAIGPSWRETVLTQVGWSFVAAACLVVLDMARRTKATQRVMRGAVAAALTLAMTATLLANWQHAETRRRSDADALMSLVASSAVLSADGPSANDARCQLIEALTEEIPDGWASGENIRSDLERLWLTRYGFPYCQPQAK